jgi:diaminohydroxyphosphoribosylaminopyrimidine deaminase/5-amino-6-(5-phosphoribosylamino)uracil reductase
MSPVSTEIDMMKRALHLAGRGGKHTFPNPLVGALVVDGDGEIAGEGWHARCGGPHAEVEALKAAGERAAGGTLYVTLEPCCHFGRTPPCTDAIIDSRLRRVVIALKDPNPGVSGAGAATLRDAGIDVATGVLEDHARQQNRLYIHYLNTGRSMVHLKLAVSLDGKTAAADGSSRWITGTESRRRVHMMRKNASSVMIGAETLRRDNPALTVREVECPDSEQPVRIVLSRSGNIGFAERCRAENSRLIIVLPDDISDSGLKNVTATGAKVWLIPPGYGGVDLQLLLRKTASEGFGLILCEGGHTLATALLGRQLVDRISIFCAPIILGQEGIPALGRLGIGSIDECIRLEDIVTESIGSDCLIEGNVVYRAD